MARFTTLAAVFTLGTVVVGGAFSSVSADSVRIGVNVGIPAPVVVAPLPSVVINPGVPVYFYGGGYYTFYNGAWFVSGRHGGPWGHHAGPPPWERHPRERHWREGHFRGHDRR
jgi:hypothetical protein